MKGLGKLSPSTVKPSFLVLPVGKVFTGGFLEGKFSHLLHLTAFPWRELGNLNPLEIQVLPIKTSLVRLLFSLSHGVVLLG